MNNKFYPWAMPLQAPLPSQKLPSQPSDGADTVTWEQYQAIKKATADEVRKSKNRKWSRKKYYRMKSNEERYRKRKIRNRMNNQRWRAAKKESINKEREDAAETLLSLGKEG